MSYKFLSKPLKIKGKCQIRIKRVKKLFTWYSDIFKHLYPDDNNNTIIILNYTFSLLYHINTLIKIHLINKK